MPSCVFSGKVTGDTATFDAQRCTLTSGSEMSTFDFPPNTFALTANTATVTVNARLSSSVGPACDYNLVGSYTRR